MKRDLVNEERKVQGMKSNLLLIIIASVITLVTCSSGFASSVVLQWDPNSEPDLAGYKVYYKADSSAIPFDGVGATEGAAPIDVRNQTTTTIDGIDPSRPYFFAITAYNSAGIESAYSNIVNIPESMPPSVAITSPSNASTVSGTVSVNATASDNVGVTKVEFYLDGLLKLTDTSSPYIFSWNTSSLFGNHSLLVKAYDAAGNIGQSSNVNVTVINDTTAPTVSITTPANGSTVRGTVSMNVTATDNVSVTRVEFFENGVLKAAMNTSPYTYSWITSSLNNGSYTLTAKAYDNAGNAGQASSVVVTVLNDTTAPVVDISSPSVSATLSGTVAVSATASDDVAVTKVEFFVNGNLQASSSSAPYSFNWNSASVANGAYSITAKAYDAAGNIGQAAGISVTVFNDTTAPSVAISSPVTNSIVGGTATISATASDNIGVSKVDLYVNGVLKSSSATAPYGYSWDTAAIANGTYNLTAMAYDAAGNIGQSAGISVTVFNDTTAPDVAISSPSDGATLSGTVAVSATASDNVAVTKVEFFVNGNLQASSSSAPYRFDWNSASVANGAYSITAKAYDATGNIGQSASVNVTVFNDTTAPSVSISSPVTNSIVGGTATISATASDNIGVSKVDLYVNGVLKSSSTTAPYGYSWDTAAIANGTYNLTAKAYDTAGNIGQSTSVNVTVFNDTTAPVVAISSPSASATLSGTIAVSATASDNVAITKVEFFVNGNLQASSSSAPYSFNWNTTSVANGTYNLTAKAYDAAGNIGQAAGISVTVFNDITAPVVAISSPSAGANVSGTVAVSATASDNVAVTKVEFFVNGNLQASRSSAPYSFNWNSTSVANGAYNLTAKAYDAAGNIGQASSVNVAVNNPVPDVTAPTITFITPISKSISGTSIKSINISASATDNVAVTKMELYVDGKLLMGTNSSSINTSLSIISGVHVIMVKAYDAAKNIASSSKTVI